MLDLDGLLRFAVEHGASDVHVKVGSRPRLRVDGRLREAPFDTVEPPTPSASPPPSSPAAAPRPSRTTNECDFMYGIAGLGRFRVSAFRQRGWIGLRAPPGAAGHPQLRRARAAARGGDAGRAAPHGTRARHRPRRFGQDRDARGDGRPREHAPRGPHRDDRGPGRGAARRQAVDRRPARGRLRHAERGLRPRARAAPGSRRRHARRAPRRRRRLGAAPGGRDRTPRARRHVDGQRDRHHRPVRRAVPPAPPTPGARRTGVDPARHRLATTPAACRRPGPRPRGGGAGREHAGTRARSPIRRGSPSSATR